MTTPTTKQIVQWAHEAAHSHDAMILGCGIPDLRRFAELARADLIKEVDSLKNLLAGHFTDASLSYASEFFGVTGAIAPMLIEIFAQHFKESHAENYLEMSFKSSQILPSEVFIVRVQKVLGKTPHALRLEAEAERDALKAKLAEVEKQEPVGEVESAVPGCAGFHVLLDGNASMPKQGTKVYLQPLPEKFDWHAEALAWCQKAAELQSLADSEGSRAVKYLREVRRLRKEAAPQAVEGWQSIETAPRDGTLVVVYSPNGPDDWPDAFKVTFDYVCPDYEDWFYHCESREHYLAVGGSNAAGPDCVCTGPAEKAPYTHWMPLPAAPKEGV